MVDHPVVLRVARFPGAPLPAVIERTDANFVRALLDELSTDEGRRKLASSGASKRDGDGVLRLFQPVQRTFNLVVFELVCDVFGEPRLDPARIASAGLVVRRVVDGAPPSGDGTDDRFEGSPPAVEAWAQLGAELRGWVPRSGRAVDADPEPARRRPSPDLGSDALNRRLPGSMPDGYREAVSPLFQASPALCAQIGKTIVYGLLPVTSSERSEGPGDAVTYSDDDLAAVIPPLLQPGAATLGKLRGVTYLTVSREDVDAGTADARATTALTATADFKSFQNMLRLLGVVLNAFDDGAFIETLDAMKLRMPSGDTVGAGRFMQQAANFFLFANDPAPAPGATFAFPQAWALPDAGTAAKIAAWFRQALAARAASVLPREGRFEKPGATYQYRAFVRVTRSDGCPPAIVWSRPSEKFRIADWYERGKVPPPLVALPSLTLDNLKKFQPNVSFAVPGPVMSLLNKNSADDFLKGRADKGSDGLAWICGFNIPLITLCAFIVLSIFLSLLNIVFWWLLIIKICIPVPSSLKNKLPNGSVS